MPKSIDLSGKPKLRISGNIAPSNDFMSLFGGESISASDVSRFLDENKDADTIVVEISSPGGFVGEGFQIHDLLKNSGKKVIGIGYAVNSIATVAFLGCTERYVTENVQFVIHNARIDPMLLGMDPLTSEDLTKLAEETEKTDERILNLYCKVLGEEHRSALLALMGAESDLGSKGAVKYGFANGIYSPLKEEEKKKKEKQKNYCVEDCMTNYLSTINQMENEKVKALETKFDKLLNTVKGFFKHIKNDVTLDAGEKKIIVITDDENTLVGKKAVYADEAGLPTEEVVPEGEYPLADGRTLVVGADGMVSEVKEAVDVAALQEELKNKNTEITNLKTQITNLEKAGTDSVALINELRTEFNKFKAEVPGDKAPGNGGSGSDKKEPDFSKMTTSQRLQALSIEKHKNNHK